MYALISQAKIRNFTSELIENGAETLNLRYRKVWKITQVTAISTLYRMIQQRFSDPNSNEFKNQKREVRGARRKPRCLVSGSVDKCSDCITPAFACDDFVSCLGLLEISFAISNFFLFLCSLGVTISPLGARLQANVRKYFRRCVVSGGPMFRKRALAALAALAERERDPGEAFNSPTTSLTPGLPRLGCIIRRRSRGRGSQRSRASVRQIQRTLT